MPSRELGTVPIAWISLLACVALGACDVDVSSSSSSDSFGGSAPGFGPVAVMPAIDIPVNPTASSLTRPLLVAPPPPSLQCLEDAGNIALTRSRCPTEPPEPGACDDEALDCLYPASGECVLAFECALGVWTPLGERCPGPEVSLDVVGNVEQPVATGSPVSAPVDAAVSDGPDAALTMPADAGAVNDAGSAAPSDAGIAAAIDAAVVTVTPTDAAVALPSAPALSDAAATNESESEPDAVCPGLAPITGSPCGAVVLVCSYAPAPASAPTRAFACSCGRWYELAPSEVSP